MRTVHESDKCVAIHVYSTVLSRKQGNSTAGVFCGGERREGKKSVFKSSTATFYQPYRCCTVRERMRRKKDMQKYPCQQCCCHVSEKIEEEGRKNEN